MKYFKGFCYFVVTLFAIWHLITMRWSTGGYYQYEYTSVLLLFMLTFPFRWIFGFYFKNDLVIQSYTILFSFGSVSVHFFLQFIIPGFYETKIIVFLLLLVNINLIRKEKNGTLMKTKK